MLRASGMMAFHIYWSISLFFPFQWLQYGFKSQAAVKNKKSKRWTRRFHQGWARGSQKPELDLLEQLRAGSAQKKTTRVESSECGEKGKTVHPRKVQSRFVDGILLLFCLIIAPSKPEIIMLNDNKSLLTP